MDVDSRFEELAKQLVEFHWRLEQVVKDVPDDDVRALIAKCRREASPLPGDSHNFPMPEWDRVADLLEAELGVRCLFRRATEHKAKTGSDWYCAHCDGACTPEHIAEMGD
jgi:hypothetical protein